MNNAVAARGGIIGPRYPIAGVTYRSAEEAARELQAGNYHDVDIGETARRTLTASPSSIRMAPSPSQS